MRWFNSLQRQELGALLTHDPVAEKPATIGQVHDGFGAINVAIGAIDQLKPEAVEAVGVPDAVVKAEAPSL